MTRLTRKERDNIREKMTGDEIMDKFDNIVNRKYEPDNKLCDIKFEMFYTDYSVKNTPVVRSDHIILNYASKKVCSNTYYNIEYTTQYSNDSENLYSTLDNIMGIIDDIMLSSYAHKYYNKIVVSIDYIYDKKTPHRIELDGISNIRCRSWLSLLNCIMFEF